MSQHLKERHAAAMLIHNIASGVEALEELSPDLLLENYQAVLDIMTDLGELAIRIGDIELAKREMYRAHQ